jgi:ubiquinone/menaquinone biosynthesis C-methylase UbiE
MEYFNIDLFDQLTGSMYAPAYPVIARQILKRTGVESGNCLDIGTGCGYLAIALAQITQLRIAALDIAPRALVLASERIAQYGLSHRVRALAGDVHQLPFADQGMQLVVSRASISFWRDFTASLREIYRVLAPGGFAYLGGGFGSDEFRAKVEAERKELGVDWTDLTRLQLCKHTPESLLASAAEAGIANAEVFGEGGLWLIFSKPEHTR